MRVSSAQIFDGGTLGILNNQAGLFKTQNQLSTGRRVLAPEDDPVAAAQALVTEQAKGVNARYIENQGTARDQLRYTETKLVAARNALQEVLSRAQQAGNATMGDSDRLALAHDVDRRLEELVAVANTQDGLGRYIFAGFQTGSAPFSVSANVPGPTAPAGGPFYQFDINNRHVTYSGDTGARELQVDSSRIMNIGENGNDVFMRIRDRQGNLVDRSVFDAVRNLSEVLKSPISTTPALQAAYSNNVAAAIGDVTAGLDNILTAQSAVGARLAELDSLTSASEDVNLQYQSTLSGLQDLDWASAITQLQRQQMTLEAAQQSYARISGLTLFNVL